MQTMITLLYTTLRRKQTSRESTGRDDRRSGAPARREPEPMPRMRWYS
jgi:hypothetical protein